MYWLIVSFKVSESWLIDTLRHRRVPCEQSWSMTNLCDKNTANKTVA
jgi:hypothetical protein